MLGKDHERFEICKRLESFNILQVVSFMCFVFFYFKNKGFYTSMGGEEDEEPIDNLTWFIGFKLCGKSLHRETLLCLFLRLAIVCECRLSFGLFGPGRPCVWEPPRPPQPVSCLELWLLAPSPDTSVLKQQVETIEAIPT